jgi:hypothetical protein
MAGSRAGLVQTNGTQQSDLLRVRRISLFTFQAMSGKISADG